MNAFRILSPQSILLVLLMTLSLARAHAQDASQSLAERYASGSIDTSDIAKAALDDVIDARVEIDRMYSSQRIACYDRFFASSCMNDVREKQRAALSKIRKIEVEANAFLRKEKAAERDRALAEREVRAKQQPDRSVPITGKTREPAAEVPDASDVKVPSEPPVNSEP
jgi:colicin import membrane protein